MCALWSNLSPTHQFRLDTVLYSPGNQTCADCSEKLPQWVSFLIPRVEVDKTLGVLICQRCALHHHTELGEKRCTIKCLKMVHEWTEEDTHILEYSGNLFVNSMYEGKVTGFNKYGDFDDDEDEEAAAKHRAKFIKYKYKKQKFLDEAVYYQKMLELLLGNRRGQAADSEEEQEEKKEEERSSSSSSILSHNKKRSFRRIRSIPQSKSCQNLTTIDVDDNQETEGEQLLSPRSRSLQRCASNPDNMASLTDQRRQRRSTAASFSRARQGQGQRRRSRPSLSSSPSRRRVSSTDTNNNNLGRSGSNRSLGSGLVRSPSRSGSSRSLGLVKSPSRSGGSGRNLGLVQSPKIDMRNRRLSAMACNPLHDSLVLPNDAGNNNSTRRNVTSYAA